MTTTIVFSWESQWGTRLRVRVTVSTTSLGASKEVRAAEPAAVTAFHIQRISSVNWHDMVDKSVLAVNSILVHSETYKNYNIIYQ